MNRSLSFQTIWNRQTDKVKRYCAGTLQKKFGLNVEVDEETARMIALVTLTGGETVWQGEKEINKNRLSIRVKLQEEDQKQLRA